MILRLLDRLGAGWWECPRCGSEYWDAKTALGHAHERPGWRDCWFCGNPIGRRIGYALELGHASPWYVYRLPRRLLFGNARRSHDLWKRITSADLRNIR